MQRSRFVSRSSSSPLRFLHIVSALGLGLAALPSCAEDDEEECAVGQNLICVVTDEDAFAACPVGDGECLLAYTVCMCGAACGDASDCGPGYECATNVSNESACIPSDLDGGGDSTPSSGGDGSENEGGNTEHPCPSGCGSNEVCVAEIGCTPVCSSAWDCASGCCGTLESGGGACAPAELCGGADPTGEPGGGDDGAGGCPWPNDGQCDEPEGTGLCPEGTDYADCTTGGDGGGDDGGASCPWCGDGVCDEPEGTGACPEGSDWCDCW